jgi:NitT/TauT family transport system substrate-binding protein
MFHGPLGIQTRDLTFKPEVRKSLAIALETLTLLKRTDSTVDLAKFVDDRYLRQAAKESKLDYQARLARTGPVPIGGKDARTGKPITDPKQAAEIWVTGEPKMRRYATVSSAFVALGELEKKGQKARVALVHDRGSGIKLLADKVWYVVGKSPAKGAKAPAPTLDAFLARDAAEAWAKEKGGTLADFPTAKGSVVTAALGPADSTKSPAQAVANARAGATGP